MDREEESFRTGLLRGFRACEKSQRVTPVKGRGGGAQARWRRLAVSDTAGWQPAPRPCGHTRLSGYAKGLNFVPSQT